MSSSILLEGELMSQPRVFVAGATGLTGRYLVEAFCRRGISTLAHIRPDSARVDEWTRRFHDVGAETSTAPWRVIDIGAALAEFEPTLVYGCLGTTKKRSGQGDGNYDSVDFGLTAMLADAAASLPKPPMFVYISAVGVSPDVQNAYLKARAKAEAHLGQLALPVLIARPSFITGDRDDSRPLEAIGATISDGLLAGLNVFGMKRWTSRFRRLYGRDLAEGLAQLGLEGGQLAALCMCPKYRRPKVVGSLALRRKPPSSWFD